MPNGLYPLRILMASLPIRLIEVYIRGQVHPVHLELHGVDVAGREFELDPGVGKKNVGNGNLDAGRNNLFDKTLGIVKITSLTLVKLRHQPSIVA